MLIVNSPSNPTGWVIDQDEQRALREIAERHDLVILADEVYERSIYDGRRRSRRRSRASKPIAIG
jgi:aspartate/methionine/tyrosine aminotransferase